MKNHFASVLAAGIGFAVLAATIFFPVCVNVHHDFHDPFNQKTCTFSIHSYIRLTAEPTMPFMLPLVGELDLLDSADTTEGYFTPPYRPPRFHS
ncbi:MAG: hypothetical protein JRH18_08125 [Deltaproteobacteria bacterium]|nr:hypothetical protein [Deltaproteobacteria bacterium]MBW1960360.1 hypothetical protein [Deltaproteobacteria bacterium]MBW1993047.1 hypothetical protein [Deltaproteobacteria bacterium]MBW2151618.1 hypothetical protein [Deltaproteobacteria bacterium]